MSNDLETKLTLELQREYQEFISSYKETKDIVAHETFKVLPTGIEPFDHVLGGGIALGSLCMLLGRAGCGKSSLACSIMSSLQRTTKGQCILEYFDFEGGMTKKRLETLGVQGIHPKHGMKMEQAIKIIDAIRILKEKDKKFRDIPVLIVWDSVASTLTEKEIEAENPKEIIGFKARMFSMAVSKLQNYASKYNITVIFINQLRDQLDISGRGLPSPAQIKGLRQGESIPGGRALVFSINQLIYLTDMGKLESSSIGFDGKEVQAECIKNRLTSPLNPVRLSFSYHAGYSNFWSKFVFLKQHKYIVAGGAWYSMKNYEKKFQTKSAIKLYMEDENFRNAMNKNMEEIKNEELTKIQEEIRFARPDDFIEENKEIEIKEVKANVIVDKEKSELSNIVNDNVSEVDNLDDINEKNIDNKIPEPLKF